MVVFWTVTPIGSLEYHWNLFFNQKPVVVDPTAAVSPAQGCHPNGASRATTVVLPSSTMPWSLDFRRERPGLAVERNAS